MKKVILATHNAGKVKELENAFAPLGWELVGLDAYGLPAPEENGGSFEANAELKARAAEAATGLWALADDSGLEVLALNGAPGVETAHFGGWEKLLTVMTHLPAERRQARFVCVLALRRPGEETLFFEGVCGGEIASEARGDSGFGYDPVFIATGETRTFAEMSKDEKSKLSHRGRAVAKLMAWMADRAA